MHPSTHNWLTPRWSHLRDHQKVRNTGSKYTQGLHSWGYDPRGGRSRPTARCLNLQIPLQIRTPLFLETKGAFYFMCFSENLLPGCFGLFRVTTLSFSSFCRLKVGEDSMLAEGRVCIRTPLVPEFGGGRDRRTFVSSRPARATE